jgi:hypothetical protein
MLQGSSVRQPDNRPNFITSLKEPGSKTMLRDPDCGRKPVGARSVLFKRDEFGPVLRSAAQRKQLRRTGWDSCSRVRPPGMSVGRDADSASRTLTV